MFVFKGLKNGTPYHRRLQDLMTAQKNDRTMPGDSAETRVLKTGRNTGYGKG
jgi:hypothetical protein